MSKNDSVQKLTANIGALKKRVDDHDTANENFATELEDLRTKVKDWMKKSDESKVQITGKTSELEAAIA